MKDNIHPKYYDDAKIKCACGAEFFVGSTEKEIHVEICSMCHPFFTGKEKLIDTAGRVDKFQARIKAAEKFKASKELKGSSVTPKTGDKTEIKKEKIEKPAKKLDVKDKAK